MTDLSEKLKEKAAVRAKEFGSTFWKPQDGEILEGEVTAMGSTITSAGEGEYVDIRTVDGETFTVFINAILEKQIDVEEVKEGDRIAIQFLGRVPSKKNPKRSYKDYLLVVAREEK